MEIKALLLQLLVASLIGFILFLATREQMYKLIKSFTKVFVSKFTVAFNTIVNSALMSNSPKIDKDLKSHGLVKRSKY